MSIIISGIQQIGIGVQNVHNAWKWYRKHLGFDVKIFEEAAAANLMLPYTGGKPQTRHAILAYNLQGGGGFEIWQYTSRTPTPPKFEVKLGDLGIFITKIKTPNVEKAYQTLKNQNQNLISKIQTDPEGKEHFYLKDPFNNIFEIVKFNDWHNIKENKPTGGVGGAVIGVTDIDKSITFYSKILGYDTIVYDKEEKFDDFETLPGGNSKFRRVLLRHSKTRKGHFSRIFQSAEIELIQAKEQKPRKIFENRYWGELGYIHLCFDITGMNELKQKCTELNYPFTVDSASSFDMGEAAGRFTYIEDPDGTLIEFVETHKIPIIKKIGWYKKLTKRNPEKPLPKLITKALSLSREKDK